MRPFLFSSMLLLWLGLLAGVTSAQSRGAYHDNGKLPEGSVGEHIQALLDVLADPEPEAIRQLVKERFAPTFRDAFPHGDDPYGGHVAQLSRLHGSSLGYDFVAIREYEDGGNPGEVVVILQNRLTDVFEAIVMQTEQQPPHLIAGLSLSPARAPSNRPAPGPLSPAEVVAELEAFVAKVSEADVFSGTVLLARDDQVLFRSACGLASKRFTVPNHIDTKFNLGSMNKMFTGVAITRLAQDGKLSLQDPISKYLDDDWLPNVDKSQVRIEHLLTHTSGLGSYFNQRFMESSRALFREVDDYRPLLEEETLAFEPGSRWQYSNSGMFVLGVIIEKVTGQSYFDVIRQLIYRPAHMQSSDSYDMDEPVPNLAIGYEKEDSPSGVRWRNNLYQHVIRGGPAGGGFSTVDDLYAFARALTGERLLDAEHTALALSAKPDIGSDAYGYGFGLSGSPQNRIVGHSGGFNGISANLSIYLDRGWITVVLSNYGGAAQIVQRKMDNLLSRVADGG
ncbi:MAG: serine hydrolase domain-containing protein [Planctomycetota bacterium]